MDDGDVMTKPRPSPEQNANCVSKRTFLWTIPFFKEASKKVRSGNGLALDTLPKIPKWEEPIENKRKLERLWADQMKNKKPSLVRAMLLFMGREQVTAILLMQCYALLQIGCAVLVNYIVKAIETISDDTNDSSKIAMGYVSVGLLCVMTLFGGLLQQNSWHVSSKLARQFWVALTAMIFEKPALISSSARADIKEGDLTNMIQQDAQQIVTMLQFVVLTSMWPGFLLVASAMLFLFLGWPFVVGLIVNVLNSFACDRVADWNKKQFQQKMIIADKRQTILNEVFQGIRTVKFGAWEDAMAQRVENVRKKELVVLKKIHLLQSLQQSLSFGVPVLGAVGTFFLYEKNGGELDASTVFVCVGLFELLTFAVSMLPHFFTMSRMILVNVRRIQRLLEKDVEIQRALRDKDSLDGASRAGKVSVQEANFAWNKEKGDTLTGITLSAEPGQLITVCSRVGGGKTTLASGMLSLADLTAGTLSIEGSTAYVPQTAQILNDTVRNNILFGAEYEEILYQKVIAACALTEDLDQFAGGDQTEIGEKGVTISGGQKQRVSLARAAYAHADVVVLDDPLSAMDAHVGKKVFDQCICGLLGNTTRIFCTNQLQFCTTSDCVYMLDNLRLAERGTYAELADAGGPFAQMNAALVGKHRSEQAEQSPYNEDTDAKLVEDAEKNAASDTNVVEDERGRPEAKAEQLNKEAEWTIQESGKRTVQPLPKKVTQNSRMTVETKKMGHVGISDFLVLARASNSFCLGVGVIVLAALTPIMKYLVTGALSEWSNSLTDDSTATSSEKNAYLMFYLISALVFCITLLTRGAFFVIYFLRSSRQLHRGMLQTVLRQPMQWFDTTPIGRILNRFSQDTMQMDQFLPMFTQFWSLQAGTTIVTVFLACIFAPPSLVLSVVLLILFALLYLRYGEISVDLQRLNMLTIGPLTGAFSGFLGALDTIRAFGRVNMFVDKFVNYQTGFISSFYWQYTLDRAVQLVIMTPLVTIFVTLISIILLLLAGDKNGIGKLVTPARAGMIIAFANTISLQLPMVVMLTARLEQSICGTQRINEYKCLAWEPGSSSRASKRTSKADSEWLTHGELSLRNICMRYHDDLPLALDDVSLDAKPAQKIAIVGRTGSGKSSVVLVIFRMVTLERGSVKIDSANIHDMPLPLLRGDLGIIPQDCWMFSGTIRNNMDVNNAYTDDQLWEVLRLVQLEEQVRGFEGGLDHEVKEKGENMSLGTRQLLCLGRVLLKKPKLIFMDEATASVDVKTDALVQKTIRSSFPESTIVTIAHRLNTIIDFDRVAVLDKGKLVEFDSPHQLLENEESIFTKLVRDSGAERELRERARAAQAGTKFEDDNLDAEVTVCSI